LASQDPFLHRVDHRDHATVVDSTMKRNSACPDSAADAFTSR
jgi:hypothetical protein